MAIRPMFLSIITGALTLSPAAMAGKTTVSVDTDFVLPLGGGPETPDTDVPTPDGDQAESPLNQAPPSGFSVTARAGYKVSFVIVDFTPEVGLRSLQLTQGEPLTFLYGGRIAVGKLIKPGIYAHGLYDFDGNQGWEGGLTGDFTALPIVNLGLQAGYGEFNDQPMLNVGIHGSLEF